MAIENTILLLGATGYLGSQFLVDLGRKSLPFSVIALVRNVGEEKEAKLKKLYPNLEIIEGTLEDADKIKDLASKAKYVINSASAHSGSVDAILAGLEKQSAVRPGDPPVYIHISGLGILTDYARGEEVDEATIPRYSDVGFHLEQLPPPNQALPTVKTVARVVAAGTRQENPIRTIIVFPGYVYGLGEGFRKSSLGYQMFLDIGESAGFAGTWGPGHNSMTNIHIKDYSNGLMMIFEAILQDKADEGAQGYYFLTSDEPPVTFREVTQVIGDVMFSKGHYKEGGTQPLPQAVTEASGDFGWALMGGNHRVDTQRLRKLGWEAKETKKVPLLESLPLELEVAIRERQGTF
ncbi:hypothetical protein M413DRAFT_444414 [Hebeloma cylindrosporum]|uniref:NmrA-like domain-containing protein n=1 Tax=Hebeloma cylindrosporum TaxID=76867 RepID=A0A0C3C1I5_HEBCY|nr:hypothetical protein M413DRAFT_444414 [Hebeloma cylindrosporum h7]